MPRSSRRIRDAQPGPSNRMEVDSDSGSDEHMSQVSRTMERINVSQGRRGKTRASRQLDSDSEEEPEKSRGTQRMNGTQKGRGRRQVVNSDSDEEPQPSTSQAPQKKSKNNVSRSQKARPTMSQASTSRAGETMMGEDISASQISPNTSLTDQEHNHHVANVVKYILAADRFKKVPIQKSNISKDVNCHNKTFREIFKSAQEILRDVFGYLIVDIDDEHKNDGKNQGKQGKSQKFILVNTIEDENVKEDTDEETNLRYLLLFCSLTHIFMSGDKCTYESLENFLRHLGVMNENNVRHKQFGDTMETIKEFIKEKYIHEGPEKELTWGIRAVKELKPRKVMEFISRMCDGRSLESWPQEYQLLLTKEQERNQQTNGQVNGTQE